MWVGDQKSNEVGWAGWGGVVWLGVGLGEWWGPDDSDMVATQSGWTLTW